VFLDCMWVLNSPSLSSAELLCHKCRSQPAMAERKIQSFSVVSVSRILAQTALSSSIRKLQTDTTV
jgi:hypothetical protein